MTRGMTQEQVEQWRKRCAARALAKGMERLDNLDLAISTLDDKHKVRLYRALIAALSIHTYDRIWARALDSALKNVTKEPPVPQRWWEDHQ